MQTPGEDEEDLVGVVVNMLGEFTGDVGDLDVVVVDLADDVRGPQAAAVATDYGPNAAAAEHWQDLAARLKAFADPTRLCLLASLRTRPDQQACVKELTQATGLAQPLVSHHLQILRRALLVNSTRHGSHVYYQLDASAVQATAQELTRT